MTKQRSLFKNRYSGVRRLLGTSLLCTLLLSETSIQAAKKDGSDIKPPASFSEMIECKDIAKDKQRLACYDEKVSKFAAAQENNEIVVAGKEDVREARRGLFGLTLPRIRLFSGNNDGAGQVNAIKSTIKSVYRNKQKKWVLTLDDNAVWRQTRTILLRRSPKVGNEVILERKAMGRYTAKINGQSPMTVIRVR